MRFTRFYKVFTIFHVLFYSFNSGGFSQEIFTQSIRGVVIDKASQFPLTGVNIILIGTESQAGTITNEQGNFRFDEVVIGRYDLQASYLGFKTVTTPGIELTSAKEMVLEIEMEEKVLSLEEVTVKAYSRKDRPINEMATVSARSFTVEETNRYPGSYGDPARMAANYAGVMSARDNRNDIVIRGNSSTGLLWRLDGIEIPNPNHFGATGTTGGPISILNNNLLTNSDFYTGAFPAEYGNAIAGVFDLKMRFGNNERREHWSQVGWNGLEMGTEGPFSKNGNASYLVSYRYSIVALIEKIGFNLEEAANYQDLTFKFNFPNTKAGSFSLIGMGGASKIDIWDSDKDQEDWSFSTHGEDLSNSSDIGILGISHTCFFKNKSSLKTTLSAMGSRVTTKIDTFTVADSSPFVWAGEESSEIKYSLTTRLNKKINSRNTISLGGAIDLYHVSFADSQYYHGKYRIDTRAIGNLGLFRAFSQWQHRFTDNLSAYSGLYYQYLEFNKSYSFEPRMGLKWEFIPNQTINIGFGLHSQIQPRVFYFVNSLLPDSSYAQTNHNLEMSKSQQFILGYDRLFNENLRLKIEGYYQKLYNIPVHPGIPAYSLRNVGAEYFIERKDSLVSEGTGKNYGIEFTFERFFSNNYYFLFTASVFNATYEGFDGQTRNTAFNGNYVFNAIGGYELVFKNRKDISFNFGLKATWAGGVPYIPFDVTETISQGEVVLDWNNAYKVNRDDFIRANLRLGIKRNKPAFNMETAIDFQYRMNYTSVFLERIDVTTGEIHKNYRMGFYPMATWKIQF